MHVSGPSVIPPSLRADLTPWIVAVVAALAALSGCGGSAEPGAGAATGGSEMAFCAIAEDYLALQRESDELIRGAGGGAPDALRMFWSSARTQAADLRSVAPPEIAADIDTITTIVTAYDSALAGIDYDIERLITDEDPALIDRFREIDLQASANAGRRLEEYYTVACGALPDAEIELEPVESVDPGS